MRFLLRLVFGGGFCPRVTPSAQTLGAKGFWEEEKRFGDLLVLEACFRYEPCFCTLRLPTDSRKRMTCWRRVVVRDTCVFVGAVFLYVELARVGQQCWGKLALCILWMTYVGGRLLFLLFSLDFMLHCTLVC